MRSCAIHACIGRPSKRRRSGDRGVYSYHRKLAEIIARRDDSVQIGRISADSLMRTHQLRGTVELPSVPRAGPVFGEETLLCTFNASTARDSPTHSSRTTVKTNPRDALLPSVTTSAANKLGGVVLGGEGPCCWRRGGRIPLVSTPTTYAIFVSSKARSRPPTVWQRFILPISYTV